MWTPITILSPQFKDFPRLSIVRYLCLSIGADLMYFRGVSNYNNENKDHRRLKHLELFSPSILEINSENMFHTKKIRIFMKLTNISFFLDKLAIWQPEEIACFDCAQKQNISFNRPTLKLSIFHSTLCFIPNTRRPKIYKPFVV